MTGLGLFDGRVEVDGVVTIKAGMEKVAAVDLIQTLELHLKVFVSDTWCQPDFVIEICDGANLVDKFKAV